MNGTATKDISRFYMAGINYKKTDASIRSQFAIQDHQYASLVMHAPAIGIEEFFVLSTCNRTEIYGFADNPYNLMQLLCTQTDGRVDTFSSLAYNKQGMEAVKHLFEVAAGLDSQILGDYEIVGQIKKAAKTAKQFGCVDVFLERLINMALQSSKAIKNHTQLSGGTVSVSFAAVQYLRQQIKNVKHKKILLLGTGKIGRNTCKNLVDYLGTTNITLMNRTEEKAKQLAEEMGLQAASVEQLTEYIAASDIILTATSAAAPVILETHMKDAGKKIIIDLSVPCNVDTSVRHLPGITLINVDELSKMKDETLARRMAEIPRAKLLIAEHLTEFSEWYNMRKNVPVLKAIKSKLAEIHTSPFFIPLSDHPESKIKAEEKIQRVINGMASKMRTKNQKGCYYIEAINEFIATGS
jgi:glutamyl-tRNA reductase